MSTTTTPRRQIQVRRRPPTSVSQYNSDATNGPVVAYLFHTNDLVTMVRSRHRTLESLINNVFRHQLAELRHDQATPSSIETELLPLLPLSGQGWTLVVDEDGCEKQPLNEGLATLLECHDARLYGRVLAVRRDTSVVRTDGTTALRELVPLPLPLVNDATDDEQQQWLASTISALRPLRMAFQQQQSAVTRDLERMERAGYVVPQYRQSLAIDTSI
jgi:hypothetical protein